MKQKRVDRLLLGISIGSFLLMSVSFMLMPLKSLKLTPGILFWAGMALGILTQVILETRRRAFFRFYKVRRKNMQKPRNGLLSFCSNPWATVADGAMLLSFLATILAFIFTKGYGYVCYVFIATTVFSFCMHCVLNGRIFFHANNQLKVRQALEQKKANSIEKGEGEK